MTRSVWVSFSWERKWIVIKSSRENWKSYKNCPYYAKHAFFVTKVSRQSVTRVNRQNTSSQKFWKNLLSVFRDWKSHLRGSCELSRENLCVPLATVACYLDGPQLSCQNRAKLFLKFLVFVKTKYFPKTTKILKNLFVFELTKIEHVKTHFIKYNHTNEYDIHWT